MTEARLFSRHSIGTRIAALFMLLGVIPGTKKREVSDHAG